MNYARHLLLSAALFAALTLGCYRTGGDCDTECQQERAIPLLILLLLDQSTQQQNQN